LGAAYFYHLTRRRLEDALPMLVERSLAQGWRVEKLDDHLWTYSEESFVPHARAGQDGADAAPVILTDQALSGYDCILCVDGAELSADEVNAAERACLIFDGHDDQALTQARDLWKSLTGAGCSAQYWSEESGKWELKSER
jgi:DNA polymerase-3 subunit chi